MGKLVCPWVFCTGKLRSYLAALVHATLREFDDDFTPMLHEAAALGRRFGANV